METRSSNSSGTYAESARKGIEVEIAEIIHQGRSFLVCSHMNPDGDAVGSSLALGLFLEGEGKEVVIYNRDGVPALYRFIPGVERIQQTIPEGKRFDISFLLDCAGPERVGGAFERFSPKGQVIVIDHHPPVRPFREVHLVCTEAAATGELLYDVMMAYGKPPRPPIATALYLALMTDTGSFRFSNTTPRALHIAAELQAAGADHALLIDGVYRSFPPERFRLLAQVLQTLSFYFGGRVAAMRVTRGMYESSGAGDELTEGFVDIPRSVGGVKVALLLREVASGEYRVSLRSRGEVDVGELASQFQGGGHPNAAGCTIRGEGEAVYSSLLKAVGEALP